MPKRIVGVSERLLICAKEEFLRKGYQKASIREIAKQAQTSPRAVYTRFPDKEGLFAAIVGPAADGFLAVFHTYSNHFWANQNASTDAPDLSDEESYVQYYLNLIDYAYDYRDEFTLLLKCAEETRYADFIEQLTVINCGHIEDYTGAILPEPAASAKLVHVLTHSFYAGLFEPLLHNMSREEAHFYVRKLCRFFTCGTQGIL